MAEIDPNLITRRYVVAMLEIVEEFLRTNPEDVDLTANYALVEEIYSRLTDVMTATIQ